MTHLRRKCVLVCHQTYEASRCRSKNFWRDTPFLNGREALASFARASSPRPKPDADLRLLHQLSQLLASIKHAGLHGGGRNVEDQRAVLDGVLVVVDEIDDLTMIGRELRQRG